MPLVLIIFLIVLMDAFLHLPFGLFWEDATRLRTAFFIPKDIYETYQVNWFGVILIYVLYFITVPMFAICSILKWLCTVGRR